MKNLFLLSLFIGSISFAQITDTGDKVGIGTTNPSQKLHVSSGLIRLDSWHAIEWGGSNARIFGDNTGDYLRFRTGNIDRMHINANGNVGIGTTAPNEKLQVSGGLSLYEGNIFLNNSSVNQEDSGMIRWNEYTENTISKSGAYIKYNGSSNYLQFMTNTESTDYEHLRIVRGGNFLIQPNSGNVGIGTTTPESKFHVKASALGVAINDQSILTMIEGSVGGNNSKFQVLNKRNDNGSSWSNTSLRLQRSVDATPQAFIDFGIDGKNSNYGLAFGTRNGFSGTQQTRMVIEENGYVGIGTSTPDAKLAVNGNIHTKEVKVDLVGWSDFVFNKNYNLPTLKDVEQHIKDRGHLKDIPSAKDVKKNGIFLGEMDAKLLQKIEELTLYAIQQQKAIEAQNNEIQLQKEKTEKLEKENKFLKSLLERVKKLEEKIKS